MTEGISYNIYLIKDGVQKYRLKVSWDDVIKALSTCVVELNIDEISVDEVSSGSNVLHYKRDGL